LTEACRLAGFSLPSPCGGAGLCGKCRVRILAGEVSAARHEPCLSAEQLAQGWRCACLPADYGDLVIADPAEDGEDGVILTEFLARPPRGESGIWERELALPPPSPADARDDQTRLMEALGEIETQKGLERPEVDLPLLAGLPEVLRRSDFHCRAVGVGGRLVSLRGRAEGNREAKLGLAVDLGTTTLAAALCDLDDGAILAAAARDNPQGIRGNDVISRIEYASRGSGELDEMRRLAVGAIEELAAKAAESAKVSGRLVLIAVGGNPAMAHLLLGVPAAALAASPFVPAFRESPPLSASSLGWRGGDAPLLWLVPGVSAFVGGDIVAGLLAHDVARLDGSTLFLDIGTNGEIALAAAGRLHTAAAAAGPAFEGARIAQGMRAASGAVCRVGLAVDGALRSEIVGGGPARGICGTGLLDAAATLRRVGVIDPGGRLLSRDEAGAELSALHPDILSRLHGKPDGPAFWLVHPSASGGSGVALTQRDVREFQLAKGAVAAGVRILLETAGLAPETLDRTLLAGGFGSYLDPASALATGLLPAGIRPERVRSVGNAALAGTRLFLLSEEERAAAGDLARSAAYVDLSNRDGFQIAFAREMLFPET
jgi:uncharacterized 2Fe-2S/4Fe-4S cluster protein (DUF4445 family)